jgi:hypothetical protein
MVPVWRGIGDGSFSWHSSRATGAPRRCRMRIRLCIKHLPSTPRRGARLPSSAAEDTGARRRWPVLDQSPDCSPSIPSCFCCRVRAPADTARASGAPARARFTDRDHVDDVPGLPPASAAANMPLRKNADGRPLAGSNGSTKGLTHPAARRLLLRPAIERREGNHPVRRLRNIAVRDGCAATSGCGAAESCRSPEILGKAAAAGARTAIRVFCRGGYWPHGAKVRPGTEIHLIAIRGNQPGRVLPKAVLAGWRARDVRLRIGRVVQEARDPWQSGGCRREDGHPRFLQGRILAPRRESPSWHRST